MPPDEKTRSLLRMLPGVDRLIELSDTQKRFNNIPKSVLVTAIRQVIDTLRTEIRSGSRNVGAANLTEASLLIQLASAVDLAMAYNLVRTVNATGVVVHTNLGRSLLAAEVADNLLSIGCRYSNLEFDLKAGKRGSRYSNVEAILCEISGAEAALVVNNNAGAVLLSLETLARGKKVIVSRGELVEIGGSFRIPDVMAKSGAILNEVGATNRTHLHDYENAIENDTGLLLKVHTSNYSIVGFSSTVPLKEMVALGKKHNLPVMEDLGSGTFIDFSRYGLLKEPTVQETLATGVDVVTFSGDKLLGGPQAGIILGRNAIIEKIKRNPINRALRIDKLTLAALEGTLRLYREKDTAVRSIPTLRMLLCPLEDIRQRAENLAGKLTGLSPQVTATLLDCPSKAGGGSLPLLELPSKCVGARIKGLSVNHLERSLRRFSPPIIGRIENDLFIMDLRTIQDDEIIIIESAFSDILKRA